METKAFLPRLLVFLLVGAVVVLASQWLLPAFLPFLFGGVVAVLLRPLAASIARVTHMRRRPSAVAACLLFYGGFCLLAGNLGFLLFAQTVSLFTRLPSLFQQSILPAADQLWQQTTQLIGRFLPTAGSYMETLSAWVTAVFSEALSQLSAAVLHGAAQLARSLPGLVFGLFIGVLSSFFILMDYEAIGGFISRQLPPRLRRLVYSSKRHLLATGKKIVCAYLLLMLLTFCEVFVGLWLLGEEYAALLALLVAIVDVLPILGSGAVLIPWGLWLCFGGQLPHGIAILLLYGVVTVVRTVVEPKILGDRLGLPPLVTLISMYAGLRLLGVVGLVLAPLTVTLLVHLNRQGLLHLWRKEGCNERTD